MAALFNRLLPLCSASYQGDGVVVLSLKLLQTTLGCAVCANDAGAAGLPASVGAWFRTCNYLKASQMGFIWRWANDGSYSSALLALRGPLELKSFGKSPMHLH